MSEIPKFPVALLLLAGLLSGCATGDDRYANPVAGHMKAAVAVVQATDWTRAEKRTILLNKFERTPETPEFKAGQPYVVRFVNEGFLVHNFTAGEFFQAIAVQRLFMADSEASMPTLESLSVEPGEEKTLYFVPMRPGSFAVQCDESLHGIFGSPGTLTIR